jgi:predicted lipid-binding transport protein (Tim44 family)
VQYRFHRAGGSWFNHLVRARVRQVLLRLLGLAVALAAPLLLAPAALARGGSGSAGFGGGGFGGGRGFGGFSGHGLGGLGGGHFVLFSHGAVKAAGALLAIILGVVAIVVIATIVAHVVRVRRLRARVGAVERASLEAAQDDPAFAADTVLPAAEALFVSIQSAWRAGDREELAGLVGEDLMDEWRRRLDTLEAQGWRNEVTVLDGPHVDYVGLVNRAEDEEDRVVVRVAARLRDVLVDGWGHRMPRLDARSDVSQVTEFWTLGKRSGKWTLLSIEQSREGEHQLHEPIVATPWADVERLRDESLVEQATDGAPAAAQVAEIAPTVLSEDARAAALDLSLVDARFAPDVLAAEVRRAVEAWTVAIDGPDRALRALATPAAVGQLLHPGDPTERTRLVVRGPTVTALRITAIHGRATPPSLTVELEVTGHRYVEDRDTTAVLAGSPNHEAHFFERWRLEMRDGSEHPWQIADAAARVPASPAR